MIKSLNLYKEGISGVNLDGDDNDLGGGNPTNDNLTPIGDDLISYKDELGGDHLDNLGNLTNAEGKIIKTKDELDIFIQSKTNTDEPTIVQIGDKDFTLDKDGNAINEDGTVFMSKEDLANLEKVNEDDSDANSLDISALEKASGLQVIGENGQPKVFEPTIEGLAAREAALIEQERSKFRKEYPETFLKNNQDIADMLRYKTLYGSLEGYNNRVDYTKLSVDDKNEDQLFNLIVEYEKLGGKTVEKAREIATMYKDANKIVEAGKEAFEGLKAHQVRVEQDKEADLIVKNNLIKKEQEDYWNNVSTTILNKDVIANVTIPKAIQIKDKDGAVKTMTRQDILAYITKPVAVDNNGVQYTQYHIDKANANKGKTYEHDILEAITFLVGKDNKSIIDANITSRKIEDIKKKKIVFKLPNDDNSNHTGVGINNVNV